MLDTPVDIQAPNSSNIGPDQYLDRLGSPGSASMGSDIDVA